VFQSIFAHAIESRGGSRRWALELDVTSSRLFVPAVANRVRVFIPGHRKSSSCPFGVRHVPWVGWIHLRLFESVSQARAPLSQQTLYFPVTVGIAERRRIFEKSIALPGAFQTEYSPVIFVKSWVALRAKRTTADGNRGPPPPRCGLGCGTWEASW
jgi:hypothetical protein